MVGRRTILPLALVASLAVALPGGAAQASSGGPVAHSAGGDAPPLNPSIVGVPILRTTKALDKAADAVDDGKGATAASRLKASRRYLIRSYRGAKYLIANAPPPEAEEASAGARKFQRLARRLVRATHRSAKHGRRSIRARASQDVAGPVFADVPTAVFSVFTSQYDAATTAIGMLPDVKGNLLQRVKTTANTAIILRNRLVKLVAAAAPPVAEEATVRPTARAAQDDATTFDLVMPGVSILLGDEIQQITVTQQDTSVPAASKAVLSSMLGADALILTRVNTLWPPVTED
jgi:hypothetical protein